ncbi:FAS1-like dehydratase domain-containing protein [Amycolatopsis sp. CA-230715]|uniref:FAS1-like dehydratase domain-containing protein n=1 Tax=Amycolatopsis sp. CA-230715 TaxID=2745196 RepID=UPI001C0140AD|nr:MaoC family dehydratase N-terminal domain-containing protein [Amycolatopsis sp. CA-230715]QWF84890.1 Mesaconyl-C(4)-CoA hydratase [Amycolatopsis sp. CA-230715]
MSSPHWEPRTVITSERADPAPVAALAALFDDGIPAPRPGDELPPLWHWVALPRWPAAADLGPDGHPARGDFLPPVDLPRRMFAGGELTFHAPLHVGETVRRESTVESVTEKDGRSGKLVIAAVRTRLSTEDGMLAIDERQDLIYREAGSAAYTPPPVEDAAALRPSGSPFRRAATGNWEFTTDPTLLMRFSAATANPHRIHYDWPYTTRVEGYPGLVVHGPLMSLALAEALRLDRVPGRVVRLAHRNKAPLFCGESARLDLAQCEDGCTADLIGPGGTVRTSLTVHIGLNGPVRTDGEGR